MFHFRSLFPIKAKPLITSVAYQNSSGKVMLALFPHQVLRDLVHGARGCGLLLIEIM
jgi:hypothetical protein